MLFRSTRVATQIKDLPFSVSVITSEFMNDFDFFDLASDLAYTANLNGVDTQGNSNLRGYGATFTLRNGFYRLGLNDRVNTDRIEIIKGPNAAIYGSTSPAGLINFVTRRPRLGLRSERLAVTTGSLDLLCGEMNVNTPLGSVGGVQFAQLFRAQATNVGSETEFANSRNRLISEGILARFRDGSTLVLDLEWSKRESVTATSTIPFEYNTGTRTYSSVQRKDLARVSQGGPDSVQNRELNIPARAGFFCRCLDEQRERSIASVRIGGKACRVQNTVRDRNIRLTCQKVQREVLQRVVR